MKKLLSTVGVTTAALAIGLAGCSANDDQGSRQDAASSQSSGDTPGASASAPSTDNTESSSSGESSSGSTSGSGTNGGSSSGGDSGSSGGGSSSQSGSDSSSSADSGMSSTPSAGGSDSASHSPSASPSPSESAFDREPVELGNTGPKISFVTGHCSGSKYISQWRVQDPDGVKSVVVNRYNEYNAKLPYAAKWMGPETGDGNHWASTSNGGQKTKTSLTVVATDKAGNVSQAKGSAPSRC